MSCSEGWTSCNGFSLLVLLLLGVVLNAIPLIVSIVEDRPNHNPISCFEWWFPGIIGAGLMVTPATMMSLAARKRACCNNRTGMFLSSLWSVVTVLGAAYCIVVSYQALLEGPLICSSPANSTANCQFSLGNFSDFHAESFNVQWFFNDSCAPPGDFRPPTASNTTMASNRRDFSTYFSSKENKHRTIHFTVFLGLLLVGFLEVLCGISQILIGFLGCLCGVSKRSRVV